jgi:hypothetical protein
LAELGNALMEEWNNLLIETSGCFFTAHLEVTKPSLMQEEAIHGIESSSTKCNDGLSPKAV